VICREYRTTPGANRLYHPSLSGVRILWVKRNGIGLTKVPLLSTIGNREFSYGFASIYVDENNRFGAGEKIEILYEEN